MTHTARLDSLLSQMEESEDKVTVHCGADKTVMVSRPLLGLYSSLLSPLLPASNVIIMPDLPPDNLGHIVSILTTGTTILNRQQMRQNYALVEDAALLGLNIESVAYDPVKKLVKMTSEGTIGNESFPNEPPDGLTNVDNDATRVETTKPPLIVDKVYENNSILTEETLLDHNNVTLITEEPAVETENLIESITTFQCENCNYKGNKRLRLEAHLRLYHNIDGKVPLLNENGEERSAKKNECTYCFITVKNRYSRYYLINHFINKHMEEEKFKEEKEKTMYKKCNQCDFKTRHGDMKKHINFHHDKISDHICSTCGYKGFDRVRLKKHISLVHKKERFTCDQCGDKVINLRYHEDTVHYLNIYFCNICDYTAKTQHLLKIHTESNHLGIKYDCLECKASYSRKQALKNHKKMKHGNSLKIECVLCEKTFISTFGFQHHFNGNHIANILSPCEACGFEGKIVLAENKYECKNCNRPVNIKKLLKKHRRWIH